MRATSRGSGARIGMVLVFFTRGAVAVRHGMTGRRPRFRTLFFAVEYQNVLWVGDPLDECLTETLRVDRREVGVLHLFETDILLFRQMWSSNLQSNEWQGDSAITLLIRKLLCCSQKLDILQFTPRVPENKKTPLLPAGSVLRPVPPRTPSPRLRFWPGRAVHWLQRYYLKTNCDPSLVKRGRAL